MCTATAKNDTTTQEESRLLIFCAVVLAKTKITVRRAALDDHCGWSVNFRLSEPETTRQSSQYQVDSCSDVGVFTILTLRHKEAQSISSME